jgi:hypothetical protein
MWLSLQLASRICFFTGMVTIARVGSLWPRKHVQIERPYQTSYTKSSKTVGNTTYNRSYTNRNGSQNFNEPASQNRRLRD